MAFTHKSCRFTAREQKNYKVRALSSSNDDYLSAAFGQTLVFRLIFKRGPKESKFLCRDLTEIFQNNPAPQTAEICENKSQFSENNNLALFFLSTESCASLMANVKFIFQPFAQGVGS